ncbi:MAG TPA: type I-MYXAN CRISPR-associated protein Cas6/Cmx6 [Gammaproteobacteria bacterium]|nr:type I-MYXAN CRISPR-associated protein Cas6/Cmx6 [Acidiferrobacteraceae bacterium]HCX86400.1 type I-MYXAN CRISPR-associated protein Cas6/Cmx6 [Gammaproteobacteria bacterium]
MPGFWQEAPVAKAPVLPETVIDLVFRTEGRQLPADHAWTLSRAVTRALPWLEDEAHTGIHLIHGAQSGNGWQQPADNGVIELSARTRFVLRVPETRVPAARALSGQTLEIDRHALTLLGARVRPLTPFATVLARHIRVTETTTDEPVFLEHTAQWLGELGISPTKMLCGRIHQFTTPQGTMLTRSLLITDLSPKDSAVVQHNGLGPDRLLGCGLFLPHKSIGAVHTPLTEDGD